MTTEIKNKIQELKSLRDKAAQGDWQFREDVDYYQGGTYVGVGPQKYIPIPNKSYNQLVDCEPSEVEYFKQDVCRIEHELSGDFIITAAARWNDLLKCLEVAVDRLQATAEEMSKDETYFITKKRNVKALSEIKNILEK